MKIRTFSLYFSWQRHWSY